MWERFVAEKTEELRDAFDQAVKEINPETKISSRRHVEVSVKSAELHAVLLGPKEVEEVQATMGGLECCLKSGEGGGFSQSVDSLHQVFLAQSTACSFEESCHGKIRKKNPMLKLRFVGSIYQLCRDYAGLLSPKKIGRAHV